MSREKQIEEMAKVLCPNVLTEYCASGRCSNSNCLVNAKALYALYNAGYRKASDVAREVFAEVTNAWANSRTESDFLSMLKELKKKYTEEN